MKLIYLKIRFLTLLFLFLLTFQFSFSQHIIHPLDPLTWQEYWTVLDVLRSTEHLNDKTRFSHINLMSPDKSLVWSWDGKQSVPRAAFAIVHQVEKTFRAEVNLKDRSLISWNELTGIQPTWLGEEFGKMLDKVKEHPDFIAAMKKKDMTI